MPLFDYLCEQCGKINEVLISRTEQSITCSSCGSTKLQRLISAPSSMSVSKNTKMPGLGDTTCCGSSPNEGNCAGPGSCCGKNIG